MYVMYPAFDMTYLLIAIGFDTRWQQYSTHLHTNSIQNDTNKQYTEEHNNLGECGPCPVLDRFTLAFGLQLRKKQGKTSVRVAASKNT